jgi:hypothetical protein
MKKIFTSLGFAALGASVVQAGAAAGGLDTVDHSKAWNLSCGLRGFYDDNYLTAPKGNERGSYGIAVTPSIGWNLAADQTTIGLRYTYGATWYQDRQNQNNSNNAWDQSHSFDALLNHAFSERFSLDLRDSFVVSQEPTLLASPVGGIAFPYRTEGDNVRNYGQATFNGALTRELGFVLGYQNTYYNYKNAGGSFATGNSLSGLLDRWEQVALINLRWQALPETTLVVGYNYSWVNYTSDEFILGPLPPIYFNPQTSKVRNNHSQYLYAGFDQNFSKDLYLTVRGGVQYIDYYNDPLNSTTTDPYGQVSLTYNYSPLSSLHIGWTLQHNQTDQLQQNLNTGSITVDQLSSVLFGSIDHRFTPKITGRVLGSWQESQFNGGQFDSYRESFFDVGVNLAYHFNNHLSADTGYTYSWLNSQIPNRDYQRNYVYVGVIAAY